MNKILLLGFSALFCWTVAQGIMCKVCLAGNEKGCYSPVGVCKSDVGRCYTYAAYFGDEPYFLTYDCVNDNYWSFYCNNTEKDGKYTHIEVCCSKEKCNGELPPLPRSWN
ncbi:uncharacterized protein LOC100553738 isoform X2 [Anolis carolinensis]|uniref:uncharacterized protein LOC100553738 isoform X2 n=1 Tax=Anolis carolinensis TaxID=28377 RepID=UPI000203AB88|nr:PREDICTED: uncharacterized protein LOC100553738 [Anolis carolinensis]|eukprot:XP_003228199.1 PREDICTED: uncharacterized protein LOC100553738 [Anolis carolinensis]